MTLINKKTNVISDLKRVIQIVESVNSKEQLEISLKCFLLFELKYKNEIMVDIDKKTISILKSKFWACYKNKEQHIFPRSYLKN